MDTLKKVDHTAIRTNQFLIIGLGIVAFLLNLPVIAGFAGIVMLLGTLTKRPGFSFFYRGFLMPLGLAAPDFVSDNQEPHLFAQGFGSAVMLAGALSLYLGINLLGWGLVWLVIALAALNLFGGFCVGCAMYYWLNRLNVPGFVKSPPPGIAPGMRPKPEKR